MFITRRKTLTKVMGDDGLTATELRQRYHKGGSIPDSDLTASQLRGRYGIQSSKGTFCVLSV